MTKIKINAKLYNHDTHVLGYTLKSGP